jgi:hypothetical protein
MQRSTCRSQWPIFLRWGSATVRLLELQVRIPLGEWMSVSCKCCVSLTTGWSLVQRSRTACDVSGWMSLGKAQLEVAWAHEGSWAIKGSACVSDCRLSYKVVQIWPGQIVTCLHTNSPGHIWTTLYFMISVQATNDFEGKQSFLWRDVCVFVV